MNVALLGFGTVGFGVYEILKNTKGINVSYVLDLVKHDDIEAKSVTDITPILEDKSVDTVIELIGGINPAKKFVVAALNAGKNVVTANKFLICENFKELSTLAAENNVLLRYTAAVGGGIPWLVNLSRLSRLSPPDKISGIFNGTTNYILDSMETEKAEFSEALKAAQDLGYAEADPSADIDGLDTLRKIVISSNIAFGGVFNSEEASLFGIRRIKKTDIEAAETLGAVCRLLGTAVKTEGGVSVYTEPAFIDKYSPFAAVKKNFNRISVSTPLDEDLGFFGAGAGRYPTAFTVVNDCLDLLSGNTAPYSDDFTERKIDNSLVSHRYYVRCNVPDEWLSSVSERVLGGGVITKEIEVSEMHKNSERLLKEDGELFFAEIQVGVLD